MCPIFTVPSGSEVSLKRFCPSGISTRPGRYRAVWKRIKVKLLRPVGEFTTPIFPVPSHFGFHHGKGELPNYQRHGCLALEQKRIAAEDQDQCDREKVWADYLNPRSERQSA